MEVEVDVEVELEFEVPVPAVDPPVAGVDVPVVVDALARVDRLDKVESPEVGVPDFVASEFWLLADAAAVPVEELVAPAAELLVPVDPVPWLAVDMLAST